MGAHGEGNMHPLQPCEVKMRGEFPVGCYRQVGLVGFDEKSHGVGHICPELPSWWLFMGPDLQIEMALMIYLGVIVESGPFLAIRQVRMKFGLSFERWTPGF